MKQVKRKLTAILLTFCMILAMMPMTAVPVYAAVGNSWSGSVNVTASETINGNVTAADGVTLYISDGVTLSVNGTIAVGDETGMLTVEGPGKLSVRGQNGTNSNAQADGGAGGAAISGSLTVNGGEVVVTGGNGGANTSSYGPPTSGSGGFGVSGAVTVSAGTVKVTGGNGGSSTTLYTGGGSAAIGGDLTVDGGDVTVLGGKGGENNCTAGAARSGSGGKGVIGTVTVNDGTVKVTGGSGSNSSTLYTGSGADAVGGDLTVNGGDVTLLGGNGGDNDCSAGAACSGGGGNAVSGDVTFSAGTVKATGGNGGSSNHGVGANGSGVCGDVTLAAGKFFFFGDGDSAVYPGTGSASEEAKSALNQGKTLMPAAEAATWDDLKTALQAGGAIVLTADVAPDDAYWNDALTVPEGVTVTLDLNGHIVDRGFASYGDKDDTYDGSVIKVAGNLFLKDSAPTAEHDPAVTYEDPISGGTVTVKGGIITGGFNDQYGGGVQVLGGIFDMEGGTIVGNRAGKGGFSGSEGLGGGVYVQSGGFGMYGGAICGNRAFGSSLGSTLGRGGGVYVNNGVVILSGGKITGNTAGKFGGGVYLATAYSGHSGELDVSGTATVTGNALDGAENNVYLEEGGVITVTGYVTGGLSDEAKIGVTMQTVGTFTSGLDGLGTAANFTSDDADYIVSLTGGEAQLCVPVEISDWAALKAALKADGYYKLTADVAPDDAYWDDALSVPSGVTATLDLNGHIVDRGYRNDSTQLWDGSVIKIEGTLTVTDSDPTAAHDTAVTYTDPISGETVTVTGGVITGGWPDQYGGVYVGSGTFNMEGGTITGNRVGKVSSWGGDGLGAGVYIQSGTFNMSGGSICGNRAVGESTIMGSKMGRGGGVYLTNGTFNMTGGTISGNEAGLYGGGVYVASTYSSHSGIVNISGTATVTGNAVSGTPNNVYLEEGGALTVTGALSGSIGVTMQTAGTFTSGLSGKGTADNFTSDNSGYVVSLTNAGEAQLIVEEYPLGLGGVKVTSLNKSDITSAIVAAGGTASGTAVYDPGTNTLTLTNFTYSGLGYNYSYNDIHCAGLYYDSTEDFTIVFSGTNSIAQTDYTGAGNGMYFNNTANEEYTVTLRSSDEGTLNVTGANTTAFFSYGIQAYKVKLVISGGTVSATGGSSNRCSYGICCNAKGTLTVDGGTLIATGGNVVEDKSRGIYINGDSLSVNNGALTAVAGTSTNGTSYGITGLDPESTTISVTGSTLIAQGGMKGILDVTLSVGEDLMICAGESESSNLVVTGDGWQDKEYVKVFVPEKVETPVFSPVAGNYSAGQIVTISCDTDGADIYYTTDGTEPSASNGTKYTSSISISGSQTIKAIAVKNGMVNSAVAEAAYTISYSVTVSPGANMTKATDSGAESQTVVDGSSITDVVYTAGDGYYFPTNYAVAAVNGISVTRDSYTQITVSGTPTADAAITLTASTAKTTPDAPDGVDKTDCTVPANNNGTLTGVDATMEYRKEGDADWTPITGDTVTDLSNGTYSVRVAATDTALASDEVTVTIAAYVAPYEPDPVTEIQSGETISSWELSQLVQEGLPLTVESENGATAAFDTDALEGILEQAGGSVTITFEPEPAAQAGGTNTGEAADLPGGAEPDGTVYTLEVTSGGTVIEDFGGTVTLEMPYELAEDENPDRVAVWQYVESEEPDAPGTWVKLESACDAETGIVTAEITSGGRFFVGYDPFPYVDVPKDAYYYDAVDWADLMDITEGVDDTTFDPEGTTTRAQMVTFLWRAAGKPEPAIGSCPFTDVDPDAYYYKAVLWAYENGITEGVGDGLFDPDGTVDRAQSVVFLFRALGTEADGNIPFTDVDPEEYYANAVKWAYENGITEGTSETTFSPDDDCIRADAVTLLYRAFAKKDDEDATND